MPNIYFPSCRFTAAYPQTAQKLAEYLTQQVGYQITGCCRVNLQSLRPEDTAVVICNTCAAFCDESSPAEQVVSIWEVLAQDAEFPLPDYRGEAITLQDCWRVYNKPAVHAAVRVLLAKMNLRVLELPETRGETRFCGISLLQPPLAHYPKLAPKRFGTDVPPGIFKPHTDAEKLALMQAHCAGIVTGKVAVYCVACADGIRLGGKQPVHVMELMFPVGE